MPAIIPKINPPLRKQAGRLSFAKRSKGSKRNGASFSRRSRAPEKKKADADSELARPTAFVPRRTPSGAPYWKGWRNWAAARQWRSPEPSRAEDERDVLNEYDREYLSSATQAVRWWNAAQWCRNTVVREGLMKSDSPYGIWEISEHSYKWLTKHSCNP